MTQPKQDDHSRTAHEPVSFRDWTVLRKAHFVLNERLSRWGGSCLIQGMNNFWMILFAVQVAIALIAFLRENGKDERFEDDKMGFRS